MEVRTEDVRVYVITGTFLVCIVAGGTCLCLYIFQRGEQQYPSSYLILGFILVGIPWLFWLLTCCYRCFKPAKGFPTFVAATFSSSSSSSTTATATATAQTECRGNTTGGGRRVHFGAVIVVGEDSDISQYGEVYDDEDQDSGEP